MEWGHYEGGHVTPRYSKSRTRGPTAKQSTPIDSQRCVDSNGIEFRIYRNGSGRASWVKKKVTG